MSESKLSPIVVMALYKFVKFPEFQEQRQGLVDFMDKWAIKGTLLLAAEGVNGTVAGPAKGIEALQQYLNGIPELAGFGHKESYTEEQPFYRTKVKLKKEIVTMGVEGIDPLQVVGSYVKPKDWNQLISDPDVVLVDTRNDYEVEVGTFKGALNPDTESFREFPAYIKQTLDPAKHKKVAMFCTGGIRCEKSTAYMKEQGFDEVYHLEGGILKYLEEVPEQESLWEGECFVFDNRVTVNHQLEAGEYELCHGCRKPLNQQDSLSPFYQKGVCCHQCHDQLSDDQRQRFAERQKQIQLAQLRGQEHIGGDVKTLQKDQRDQKLQHKLEQQKMSRKGKK